MASRWGIRAVLPSFVPRRCPRETTTPRLCRLSICRERYVRMPWRARFFPHAADGLLQHPHHKVLMLSGGANTAARNLLQRRITAIVPHNSNIKQSVHVGTPNHAATKTTYHYTY